MNHYVYKITWQNYGTFYIGVRSCACDISLDKYTGSGSGTIRARLRLYGGVPKKEIIREFNSRIEAEDFEYELIKKSLVDFKCINYRAGTPTRAINKNKKGDLHVL